MTPTRREWIGVIATGVLVTAFHWTTTTPGHNWAGDFSMYVAHARNLVDGHPYSETGYVFNPDHPRLGPRTYPPGTPVLLAVPYALYGLDLLALKRVGVVAFGLFLLLFYGLMRRREGPAASFAALLAIGLSPYLWDLKDNIGSELPFLLALYLTFVLHGRMEDAPEGSRARRLWAVAVGVGLTFAYATRSVGLVLLPALVAVDVLRTRRLRPETLIAGITFAPFFLGQSWFLDILSDYTISVGSEMGDGHPVAQLFSNLALNAVKLPDNLTWAWRGKALPHPVTLATTLTLYGLGLFGAVRCLLDRVRLPEMFALLYVGALAVLPFGGDLRRLLPVLPLFFGWAALGAERLPLRNPRGRLALAAGAALLLAVSYADIYRHTLSTPPGDSVHRASSQAFFDYVRREIPEDDTCLILKPRVFALFTGRKAAGLHPDQSPASVRTFAAQIEARWLVVHHIAPRSNPFRRYVEHFPEDVEHVWNNDAFDLYRLRVEANRD